MYENSFHNILKSDILEQGLREKIKSNAYHF